MTLAGENSINLQGHEGCAVKVTRIGKNFLLDLGPTPKPIQKLATLARNVFIPFHSPQCSFKGQLRVDLI